MDSVQVRVFSVDDYIPMEFWGKNHWSTLAYIETVMVETGGFEVGFDPRMTQNRRNFRVMAEQNPKPKRPGRTPSMAFSSPMDVKYSTALNNGQKVDRHDDWCCVQDFAASGLLTTKEFEPKDVLHLSEFGQKVCAALRIHKQNGHNFASFQYPINDGSDAK